MINLALRPPLNGYTIDDEIASVQEALQHGVFASIEEVFAQTPDKVSFIKSVLDPRSNTQTLHHL